MIGKEPNIIEIISSVSSFIAALFAILSFVLTYRIQTKSSEVNHFHFGPLIKSAIVAIVVMLLMVFIFRTVQQIASPVIQEMPTQTGETKKPLTISIDSKFEYKFTAPTFDSTIEIELRQIYKLGE